MRTIGSSAADEWRESWPVVLAGLAGIMLFTVHTYSLGVMIAPLEREFGWSRAQISAGPMIVAVCGVVMAPVVGFVIDRFGPRRVGVIGATLLCAALAMLSTATGSIGSWLTLWTVLALIAVFVGPTVWTAAVSSLFHAGRGFALAVTLCGTGLGSSLVPIVSSHLVDWYGWRGAYLGLAAFWGVLTLPLVYFCFSSAIDRRRLASRTGSAARPEALDGVTAREGFRSIRFVKLAMAAFALTLALSGFIVNLVPILTLDGLPRNTAAAIAGLIGVGAIIGRLCGGMLLDRINGNLVAGVAVTLPIVSSVLLIFLPGQVLVAFAAVLLAGLATGAELDAVAYLVTRHFGLRNFGALFGTISGLLVLANGLGPLLMNYTYDLTRSYQPSLWAMIPICLMSSVLFLTLGPYPGFAASPSAAGQPTSAASGS